MKIHKATCYEGVPKVIMAHVVGAAATDITQATVNALSYIVDQYDSEENAEADMNPTSVVIETALSPVSSYVFNTLQTDNDWDADSDGYNLKVTIPPAAFPVGAKWVRVEVWVDPTSGDDFPAFIGIFDVVSTTKD